MNTELLGLTVALAHTSGRFAAAERLARFAGADALTILVYDPDVDAFLPALGFPSTIPGGVGWRKLLTRARDPGIHRGAVDFPEAGAPAEALAYSLGGIVFVFIGGTPDIAVIERLEAVLPMLAVAFCAELEALAARGEKRVALSHAREAEALAAALDAARADLERSLRALEERSRALDDARSRAEAAGRAKDDFLAMLGHELRNPLSPMLTAVQLLRLKGHAGREHEVIERQIVNLTRLVDDLLDVSRLTAGKIVLRKEPVEIADVAARAIEMVSPLIERKRQALSVQIATRGLRVEADPVRLAQVLANLLTNASKYSDEESRITLAATDLTTHVEIRVRDEGIGISREMLSRVFDLFEQQRQAIDRSHGGLGLGLAIVRSLVTLHGGHVRVVSAGEGRGAEFIVELPHAAEPTGTSARAERPAASAAGPTSRERVLVVDDNRDALTLLAEALGTLGYVVQIAPDGPTALRLAPQFAPGVAILDIGLPVMDGYELAGHLRALDRRPPIKLVAVTGYGQEADRDRALAAGFDAHLVKPVSLADLQRLLAEIRSPDFSPDLAKPSST